jgi:hypothetical protein
MFHNFVGVNFLGKKQHIQFLQFIKGEIDIPSILPLFLTSYNPAKWKYWNKFDNEELLPIKRETIKNQLNECEWFLFEICSLKLYTKDNYVQCEQMIILLHNKRRFME